MNIAGLVKTTTVDYPGKIACAIFTAGCNYDCWFCHNRALLTSPPRISEEEVKSFLKKRAGMLEGVVISGGEPTIQPDLLEFMRFVRGLGYRVKLDTNGGNPDVIKAVLREKLADYIAMDYKAPFEEYLSVCGHSAEGVRECIELFRAADVEWELRTTVLPELDIEKLKAMACAVPILPKYALQLYRPVDYNGKHFSAKYTAEDIARFSEEIRKIQPNTIERC